MNGPIKVSSFQGSVFSLRLTSVGGVCCREAAMEAATVVEEWGGWKWFRFGTISCKPLVYCEVALNWCSGMARGFTRITRMNAKAEKMKPMVVGGRIGRMRV